MEYETVLVRKQGDCVPPERILSLDVPPYKVYEVDIRLGIAFDNRVDAEKRKIVVQRAPSYNISADVSML